MNAEELIVRQRKGLTRGEIHKRMREMAERLDRLHERLDKLKDKTK